MYWMDATELYAAESPIQKRQKAPEINALMLRPTFVISRSGVRIRPPAPTQVNMGEFQSGQMGQTVNLLAMPSVDSNRGRLETCRGHVSTRGGLPAGRRIHLIYCLLTPCTDVHVKASKMSLTQTVTQMRIGAESTGQCLPGAFCV